MTSNLGTKDLSKNIGFSNLTDLDSYEKMKSKVNEELKRYFKPEFLNRIDETIVFHELTLDEVKEIDSKIIVVDPTVDLYVKDKKDHFLPDGLHLNIKGNKVIAEKIFDSLVSNKIINN